MGERSSGVLSHIGMSTDNNNVLYFLSKAKTKDSECIHHEEMTDVGGDGFTYPDLNITIYIHALKQLIISHTFT